MATLLRTLTRMDRWQANARLLTFGAAVAGALASSWWAWRVDEQPLHATVAPGVDSDGDGLPDELEAVLGTDPDLEDSDNDGVGDAEEIARQSSPTSGNSSPIANAVPRVTMSMDAYVSSGSVHALTTIYFPLGHTRSDAIKYKVLASGRILSVTANALRGGAGPRLIQLGGGAELMILDPVVSEQRVLNSGTFSLAAVVVHQGTAIAAAAANLDTAAGEIFQNLTVSYQAPVANPNLSAGLGVGGVYRPLRSGGSTSAYTAGEICAQTTVVIGVVGGLVTQEVIAAGCVTGWDGFCSAGCSASVGSTIKTIDPGALIGG